MKTQDDIKLEYMGYVGEGALPDLPDETADLTSPINSPSDSKTLPLKREEELRKKWFPAFTKDLRFHQRTAEIEARWGKPENHSGQPKPITGFSNS